MSDTHRTPAAECDDSTLRLVQSYTDQISDFLVTDVAAVSLPCQMARAAHDTMRTTELELFLTIRETQNAQMALERLTVACTETRIQEELCS
ncbi:hypothetical protein STCU_12247 [Strigomonas culicis]|uniref:Uncharacterized protein n=1 Tax=Strigomonas culicis TaxID=28005 RepID=S9TFU7_9TRYP|nr:hypothetical protein STCU_12247 [Strigomonas culicis]|eukprot:EPY15208.1 hypothetical protein STCU_12247 [Strigomonas culicis]